MTNSKTITLENMRDMNIDQIVELYRNGYELSDKTLNTLQDTCPTTSLIMAGLVGDS